MKKLIPYIVGLLAVVGFTACSDEKYPIEFQEGYPSLLADNWIAFEFQGGSLEGRIMEPYDLVTSLDPNRPGFLIVDKLYNADVRVRTAWSDSAFSVHMGEQLEKINTNNYGIEYITVDGYVTSNPVLTRFTYDAASVFYEDMAFNESDIEDVIFIRAGFYDEFEAIIDTVLIVGYRKTGFEEVDY